MSTKHKAVFESKIKRQSKLDILQMARINLDKYPFVKYEMPKDNILKVLKLGEKGFEIEMLIQPKETIIYFDNIHWHFKNTAKDIKELFILFTFGIMGLIRLKKIFKNGEEFDCDAEYIRSDNTFPSDEISELKKFKKADKVTVVYLENDYFYYKDLYEKQTKDV